MFAFLLAYVCSKMGYDLSNLNQYLSIKVNNRGPKVLKAWNVDTTYVDDALRDYFQTPISNEVMVTFIKFCLFASSSYNAPTVLPLLMTGNRDLFLKFIEDFRRNSIEQASYYQEIKTNDYDDTFRRTSGFSGKVVDALSSDDAWIVLNYLPGELCKINGTPDEPKCARHCLRKYNADSDKKFLMHVLSFISRNPAYSSHIIVNEVNAEVIEIAINSLLLKNPDFASHILMFKIES